MARLIDADALIEEIANLDISEQSKIFSVNMLRTAQTAYNVEKVVAELCKEANETTVDFCNGVFVNVDRAIDIVRKGGAE